MKGAVIRRVAPAEWELLRTVRLAALQDAPFAFESTYERELAFTEADWRLLLTTFVGFIAWMNDQPVGLVFGGRFEGAATHERELFSMWVSPDQRGTKVAMELVTAVKMWAKDDGAEVLALWVNDGNDRAFRFYKKLCFTPTGKREPLVIDPTVIAAELSCFL
ncbi:MAG: GNAT family N-acetyltransferase [Acidimicrobiales bacterium]|nr:MAG: GNAT family N-acetyltransferase [Acidimicrobiales bacterium]